MFLNGKIKIHPEMLIHLLSSVCVLIKNEGRIKKIKEKEIKRKM